MPSRPMTRSSASLAIAVLLCVLASAACGRQPPPLILLVTVDTLRADRLGAYGSPLELTPNLDRLASESVVFEQAVTPAPFTLAALGALHTGRYPEELGIGTNASILPDDVDTLATLLHADGWRTGAVTSNYVLGAQTGIARGFERYDHELTTRERNRGVADRAGEDTTRAAVRMLDALRAERDERIFLWVHYQDPHGPYTPPAACSAPPGPPPEGVVDGILPVAKNQRGFDAIPRYQALGDEQQTLAYRAAYDGEVRCVDRAIGTLLDAVRSRGLLDGALVLFTADHGESLGEGGVWYSHGTQLDAAQLRVPLFLRMPGRSPERRAEVASLLDVAPTLLARIGVPAPESAHGRDLLASGAGEQSRTVLLSTLDEALPERRVGIVADGYRYVMVLQGRGPKERLTRLGAELEDLAAAQLQRAGAMRLQLTAGFAGLASRRPARTLELSAQEKERLRALGYVHDP